MGKMTKGAKMKHVRIGYDVWRRARLASLVLECGLGEFCEGAIEARLGGVEQRGVDLGETGASSGRKVVEVGWKKPEGVDVRAEEPSGEALADEFGPLPKPTDRPKFLDAPPTTEFPNPEKVMLEELGRPREPRASVVVTSRADLPRVSAALGLTSSDPVARVEAAEALAGETFQPGPNDDLAFLVDERPIEMRPEDAKRLSDDLQRTDPILEKMRSNEPYAFGGAVIGSAGAPADSSSSVGAPGDGRVAGKPGGGDRPVEPRDEKDRGFTNVVTNRATMEAYGSMLEIEPRFAKPRDVVPKDEIIPSVEPGKDELF